MKYFPQMPFGDYEQYIAEYMKEEEEEHFINSDDNEDKIGYDEDGNLLYYLVPNAFKETDFKIYDILDEVANSNLNTNRGASAGAVDRNLVGWGKKDNAQAVKTLYKQITKYSLERTNPNSKAKYRISNPVYSNMVGYFDKVDINCRKYIKNPPKCRLTSFTQKNFEKYERLIPYVEKMSKIMEQKCPSQYINQANFLKNKEKIGNSVFTTLTINKNFRTAIHTDSGDYKNGIGVISCMGDFTGGDFCLPNYKIQIQLKPTDLLFVNVHRHHCNTPIVGNRISVISYIRENFHKCDDDVDYKIIIDDIDNEKIVDFCKKNIKMKRLYFIQPKDRTPLRFDDITPIINPHDTFPAYTPYIIITECPDLNDDFETILLQNFKKMEQQQLSKTYWAGNELCITRPPAETITTLIEDKLTETIKLNIKSWENLGYTVNIYSFKEIKDIARASEIVETDEKYFWVLNLLQQKDTIYLDCDVLLLDKIPNRSIILSTEFNRANDKIPNCAILKMPKNHIFLTDTIRFLNNSAQLADNKRKFGRSINYFALAKHILHPNQFCKINKVYSKSIFIDYEKYLAQPQKYKLNIPKVEDLKNCIGIKTNNINQVIHKNSLYKIIFGSLLHEQHEPSHD